MRGQATIKRQAQLCFWPARVKDIILLAFLINPSPEGVFSGKSRGQW